MYNVENLPFVIKKESVVCRTCSVEPCGMPLLFGSASGLGTKAFPWDKEKYTGEKID